MLFTRQGFFSDHFGDMLFLSTRSNVEHAISLVERLHTYQSLEVIISKFACQGLNLVPQNRIRSLAPP